MSFKGALLKPSERNGAGRMAKPSRGISKQSRYEVLKEKVRNWWEDRFKAGEALREIREGGLYKHEYPTFEDFTEAEYGIKRTYAHRLIEAVDIKASVEMLPIGNKITRESQARALKPVPAEERAEVLETVAERGPVTAKAIKEVASEKKQVKETKVKVDEPPKRLDKIGYPIPEAILENWQRAERFSETLSQLTKIKGEVSRALEEGDVIFAEVTNTSLAHIKNFYDDLKRVLPYAVCTSCQGRTAKKCTTCEGRGFLSKFYYSTCVPKETRDIREKAVLK